MTNDHQISFFNFNAYKIFVQELDWLEWLILSVETRVVIDCYSVIQ